MKHIIITPLGHGLYRIEPGYEVIHDATLRAVELLEIAAWVEEHKEDLLAEIERQEKKEQQQP